MVSLGLGFMPLRMACRDYMSYSLSSLRGGYIGDYVEDYYRSN